MSLSGEISLTILNSASDLFRGVAESTNVRHPKFQPMANCPLRGLNTKLLDKLTVLRKRLRVCPVCNR